MECPYCKQPMEKGYTYCGRGDKGVFWFPMGTRPPMALLATESAVAKRNGFVLNDPQWDQGTVWVCRS